MTLAWVLFAPLAILFARFQKDPLRRLLGEQLWFQVHRLANTLTVLCALLAFVCILSALGGHWVGPRVGAQVDWAAMHAIFGLVAVLLALGQPFSALFRCHPDSSSRQVFNIWHGLSGYFAWFCAGKCIHLGLGYWNWKNVLECAGHSGQTWVSIFNLQPWHWALLVCISIHLPVQQPPLCSSLCSSLFCLFAFASCSLWLYKKHSYKLGFVFDFSLGILECGTRTVQYQLLSFWWLVC